MYEDNGEIEYLDEDEDLVQQYVQNAQGPEELILPVIENVRTIQEQDVEQHLTPLLVERKPITLIKRKHNNNKLNKTNEDSDYDPQADLDVQPQKKKRKTYPSKKPTPKEVQIPLHVIQPPPRKNPPVRTYMNKLKNLPNLTVKQTGTQRCYVPLPSRGRRDTKPDVNSLIARKKMDIKISDFEDALCLPVKAITRDEYEFKKLRQWNNFCLDKYKKNDACVSSERRKIVSTTKSILFRNVKNRNGKVETSIWGKTTTETANGDRKIENFQNVLPKYRERKVLQSYALQQQSHQNLKHTYEVILAKEQQKDEDVLVVYKPREAISAVYKLTERKKDEELADEESSKPLEMKEVTCCRVCAPCYQTSWRGVRKKTTQENVLCHICSRSFVSVYNLLSHLKTTHKPDEVRRHRNHLSRTLASVVDYHYKCRICQEQFISIKMLRKHVTKHQGMGVFRCEVGNHMAS